MTEEEPLDAATRAARADAAAAMRRLRDAAGQVLSSIAEAQPVAPHHLLALRTIREGARTPSDMAAATGRHLSSVSRVIDQLVGEGLVARDTDPADRRQVLVTLTDVGDELVERFERLDDRLSTALVSDFGAEDARRLTGYLDRIAENASALADRLEADPTLLDAAPAGPAAPDADHSGAGG